jgi:hypothetical protein
MQGSPSDLLIELLRQSAQQSTEVSADDAVMLQGDVAAVFTILDQRDDVDEDTLGLLEWTWLPVLSHSPRPAKLLPKALSEQPALFVQMLKDSEQAHALAVQAFELLRQSSHLPGTRADGTVDAEALKAWIAEVCDLAHAVGRAEVAGSQIGQLLSAPLTTGADGHWPQEAVRAALDHFRSEAMVRGFAVGKRNRIGWTSRGPGEGGAQERRLADSYRRSALAMENLYPFSAQALDSLAESYEREAKRHDQDAERLDWED